MHRFPPLILFAHTCEPYEEFGSYGYDDYGYGYEYDGYDSER